MKKFILFTTFLTLILYSSLKAQVNLQWAKQLKGTNNEIGTSIAVDASGNVYTIGYFDGTTDFDPGSTISNLTTAGYDDIFVSKLDASGNYVWAKKFGSTGFDDGQSIAVDASGVYITWDGGYYISARGVCWSTSTNPTISDSITTDGTGTGVFTSSLTGLTSVTSYYVRAYATNSQGTSYGNQQTFTSSVGIDENLFYKYLKVYPNPSNGKFKIESYNNFINSIEIINIVGQKVFSKNYLKKSKSEIDISNQNNGIYFLSVTTNDKTFTTKIILQK